MKELNRYIRGIKDLARGYGITDILAGLGLATGSYITIIFISAIC